MERNKPRRRWLLLVGGMAMGMALAATTLRSEPKSATPPSEPAGKTMTKVVKTDEEWRKSLSSMQYRVLRRKGTEPPFLNEYNKNKERGVYACAGCGQVLFRSDDKYDSGTGWPSFWQPVSKGAVHEEADRSFFMTRTEVLCSRCDGHLGHVFTDGPKPTGLRYCMNSAALKFVKRD